MTADDSCFKNNVTENLIEKIRHYCQLISTFISAPNNFFPCIK